MARYEHPHFSLPFRFNQVRGGKLEVAYSEQDTIDEIADCVELVCRTDQGQRVTLPGFGRPSILRFTTHHDMARSLMQQAINEADDRVEALVEREQPNAADPGQMRLYAMYYLTQDVQEMWR